MTFLAAAKQYALDKKIAFKLHKKGSAEYNEIKAIQETMKSEVVKAEVAPVKLSTSKKAKVPVAAAAAAVVVEPVVKVRKPRAPKSEKVSPDAVAAEKAVKPKKTAKKEGGANLIILDKPLTVRFD